MALNSETDSELFLDSHVFSGGPSRDVGMLPGPVHGTQRCNTLAINSPSTSRMQFKDF